MERTILEMFGVLSPRWDQVNELPAENRIKAKISSTVWPKLSSPENQKWKEGININKLSIINQE